MDLRRIDFEATREIKTKNQSEKKSKLSKCRSMLKYIWLKVKIIKRMIKPSNPYFRSKLSVHMCLVIGMKVYFYSVHIYLVALNVCLMVIVFLQWRKRVEIVSRCVPKSPGGIGPVFRRFHFQSLSYGAFVETKGWAWGRPFSHMGVYWIVLSLGN